MATDRANPQIAGIDRLAERLHGGLADDGLRMAARQRHYHLLVPAPAGEGPGGDHGARYDVAAHLAAATPAGPAGYQARLRSINGGAAR